MPPSNLRAQTFPTFSVRDERVPQATRLALPSVWLFSVLSANALPHLTLTVPVLPYQYVPYNHVVLQYGRFYFLIEAHRRKRTDATCWWCDAWELQRLPNNARTLPGNEIHRPGGDMGRPCVYLAGGQTKIKQCLS